jgi:hypothetical protein
MESRKKVLLVFLGGIPASLSRLFWLINPNRVGIENGKSFCNSPSSVEDGSDYSNPSWPLVLPSRAGIKTKIPFFPWESIHQNLLFWASVRSWANEIVRCEKVFKLEDSLSLCRVYRVLLKALGDGYSQNNRGDQSQQRKGTVLCVISRNNGNTGAPARSWKFLLIGSCSILRRYI